MAAADFLKRVHADFIGIGVDSASSPPNDTAEPIVDSTKMKQRVRSVSHRASLRSVSERMGNTARPLPISISSVVQACDTSRN